MKKYCKAVLFFIFIALTGCSSEEATTLSKENAKVKSTVSFEEFEVATGLKDFKGTIKIPAKDVLGVNQNPFAKPGDNGLVDFIVDTNYIRQTVLDEKITYSFSISPKIVTTKSFYNLIVHKVNGIWNYSVMELLSDEENQIAFRNGTTEEFKGSLREVYTTNTSRGTGCITIFIEKHHCTQTGDCEGGTCDGCRLCVSSDSYRLCHDNEDLFTAGTSISASGTHSDGSGGIFYADPSGYVFEVNTLATKRSLNAGVFWLGLNLQQKQWASVNPDSYKAFLEDVLDNYSPLSIEQTKQMLTSMANTDNDYSGDGFTGDNDDTNTDYDGPKQHIPTSIVTSDGTTVQIDFGTTPSDNENADKDVAVSLVESLIAALNEANDNLPQGKKITSIMIYATTNGEHGTNSNHYKGTAIDISRINGVRIMSLGASDQVSALQNGFQNCNNIRENFGPAIKYKTEADGTVNSVNISGHHDHIHISVQNH